MSFGEKSPSGKHFRKEILHGVLSRKDRKSRRPKASALRRAEHGEWEGAWSGLQSRKAMRFPSECGGKHGQPGHGSRGSESLRSSAGPGRKPRGAVVAAALRGPGEEGLGPV